MTALPPLEPEQIDGMEWMIPRPFSGAFFKAGIGKTRMFLETMERVPEDLPALVLTPKACVEYTWPAQIEEWTPHRTYVQVVGSPTERQRLLYETKADYYLLSYDNLKWFVETAIRLGRIQARTLLADDGSKLKTHNSERVKQVARILHNFKRRHLMTGTPTPNGLLQVWSQAYFVDRGKTFGDNWYRFRAKYFHQVDFKGYRWEPHSPELIHELLAPLFLSRSTYKLPTLVETKVGCALGAPALYEELRKTKVLASLGIRPKNAAVRQNKYRQISNGFVYDDQGQPIPLHEKKYDQLEALIDQLDGENVMVLYEFQQDLVMLRKRFPKAVVFSDGDKTTMARWNAGKIKLLLLQPASAGMGLNLQGSSNNMIWLGPPWDLETYQQTVARLWRRGQQKSHVYVFFLCAQGSVDHYVFDCLTAKDATQDMLFKALERHERLGVDDGEIEKGRVLVPGLEVAGTAGSANVGVRG